MLSELPLKKKKNYIKEKKEEKLNKREIQKKWMNLINVDFFFFWESCISDWVLDGLLK